MDAGNESLPPPPDAGERIRELRLRARWSQARLAQLMREQGFRWHQMTVHRVERGERELTLREAGAITGILGVPLGYLAAA